MRDTVAMKLEVVTISVGDVDRAKAFDLSKALKRAAAAFYPKIAVAYTQISSSSRAS